MPVLHLFIKKDKEIKSTKTCKFTSNILEIYEKLTYNQLCEYFDSILFHSQCGFHEGYSAKHYFLVMLEVFKKSIEKVNEFGALLTDILKAFDRINENLLISKLFWYGFQPL